MGGDQKVEGFDDVAGAMGADKAVVGAALMRAQLVVDGFAAAKVDAEDGFWEAAGGNEPCHRFRSWGGHGLPPSSCSSIQLSSSPLT